MHIEDLLSLYTNFTCKVFVQQKSVQMHINKKRRISKILIEHIYGMHKNGSSVHRGSLSGLLKVVPHSSTAAPGCVPSGWH